MSGLVGQSAYETVRERLKQLEAQRNALEIEASALASALNSPGVNGERPAGVKGPLVDSEGFPRSDLDLMAVMTQRNRLAVINTDHSAVMKMIETGLAELHLHSANLVDSRVAGGAGAGTGDGSVGAARRSLASPGPSTEKRGFALIDEILAGSPAQEAGIQDGDELLTFGTVTADTVDALNSIPAIVGANVNCAIAIEVRRRLTNDGVQTATTVVLKLSLTPKPWGGRGLLGCHLSPKA